MLGNILEQKFPLETFKTFAHIKTGGLFFVMCSVSGN